MNDPKPGIKTSEFAATIGTVLASLLVVFFAPEKLEHVQHWVDIGAMVASAAAVGLYSLARGLAKRR